MHVVDSRASVVQSTSRSEKLLSCHGVNYHSDSNKRSALLLHPKIASTTRYFLYSERAYNEDKNGKKNVKIANTRTGILPQ